IEPYRGAPFPDELWLEPACGTGRFLAEAAARGLRVVGFDRSPAMLAFARGVAVSPLVERLFEADMIDFSSHVEAQSIAVAFSLDNTFRHLEDDRDAGRHLMELAAVLRADGLAVIGLQLSEYGADPIEEDVWIAPMGEAEITQVVQYLPAPHRGDRRETVLSHTTIRHSSGREETREHRYALRSYDVAQWHRLLRASPLQLLGWSDFEGRACSEPPLGYGFAVLGVR
ncbi:MAG: class I SAM-dependent methyltransferase, partial [Planctomycetes bacterium]|nr:class I SAM-dependent methyltransferase [Planctomycetota bacterium]